MREIINGSQLVSSKLSASGFSYTELKGYSILLFCIVIVGFVCHMIIIFILIYQQCHRFSSNKSNRYFTSENKSHTLKQGIRRFNHNKRSQKTQIYSNYVTYAFIGHQIIVDFLRISYSLLYSNRLYAEYNLNNEFGMSSNLNATAFSLNNFYEKYCTPMASFYSVLTMVTIVNILTILISETCRYYDLKLNSNDTSNFCCVLFGILLIWISSLIIISSLMLVGVADSAAPTWSCDLGETESTTRSLVINIVWFLLIAFVLLIAFLYSCSLYRELNSMDYEDNDIEMVSANPSVVELHTELLKRHDKIVRETTKRLMILVCLITVFLLTFMPNFITTVLKNTLNTQKTSLRPYNIISSIINLSDATLNAIILLFLCIKSSYSDFSYDDFDYDYTRKKKTNNTNFRNKGNNSCRDSVGITEAKKNGPNGVITKDQNEGVSQSHACEIQNKKLNDINIHKANNLNRKNLKEFYSKIGNRLGTSD